MKIPVVFALFIFLFLHSYSQHREIAIGEIVPDIELTNIVNYDTSSIRLSKFEGKNILIDFWGTSCGSCVAVLPKLDSLQKKYSKSLQIISVTARDTKEKVFSTLQRFKSTRQLSIPIVLGDTVLSKYFPYELISHLVWIGKDGKLKAITGSDYITNDNIAAMVRGDQINWPVKKDVLAYDYSRPFLDVAQKNIVQPDFLYYSLLTGPLEGVAPINGRRVDSATQTATTSFFNMGLLSLAKIALDYRTGANPKEFILEVKDRDRFIMPIDVYFSQWGKDNRYSYYITLPLTISETQSRVIIQQDLTHWLRVLGFIVSKELRKVPCLLLIKTDSVLSKLRSKGGEYVNELAEREDKKLINAPIDVLVDYLNGKNNPLPWVINETGLPENFRIDMQLRTDAILDTKRLREELLLYGLDLVEGNRTRFMLVIQDNPLVSL